MHRFLSLLSFFIFFIFPLSLFGTTLKIASYNVENLFDMQKNGTEYEEYIPNKHQWTCQNFRKKLLNIAEVICDMNADIIGLQEIENENSLKKLQKTLREVGCYYPYRTITHKKKSAIQVALLSKIPIINSRSINVGKELYYRPILEVKFRVEGKGFYVYVNHWASKHSAESRRIISARVLVKRLKTLPTSTEYILLGDFNSDYNEYQHLKKEHNDSRGRVGLNHLLKTVVAEQLLTKEAIEKRTTFSHYNLWLELPSFERWSHNFYGERQALDSILVPPSMFNKKGLEYVNNSFRVFKSKYLFHKKGYIYRWQYRKKRHLGEGYSDHLPIVASFTTRAYVPTAMSKRLKEGSIKMLYKKSLSQNLLLKNIKVIFKSKYHAIIKQKQGGRAIFVYGAEGLEEGRAYDIVVQRTKVYHGLEEVTKFSILHEYGETKIEDLFLSKVVNYEDKKYKNEVLKGLEGIYKNKRFYVGKKSYNIFFKNRNLAPKNGTKLKLHRVQIGYYETMQFVIWSAENFTIVE